MNNESIQHCNIGGKGGIYTDSYESSSVFDSSSSGLEWAVAVRALLPQLLTDEHGNESQKPQESLDVERKIMSVRVRYQVIPMSTP